MTVEGAAQGPITLQLYEVREVQVILDRDLARLYGIATKKLNQYVKRHPERFPSDFMFELNIDEWRGIRHVWGKPRSRGGVGHLPHAFTHQGCMMVASILHGRRAIAVSIEILRAFARGHQTDAFSALDAASNQCLVVTAKQNARVTYFVQAGKNGPIKIGVTSDLEKRIRSLQTSSPVELRVLGVIPDDIEAECHVTLAEWRLHGEWFEPSESVLEFVHERVPTTRSVN